MASVRPVVRLFFPCDAAEVDPSSGTWVLHHPWHIVRMPAGVSRNFGQESVVLYAQLAGGLGTHSLGVTVQAFDESLVLGRSDPVSVTFTAGNRLGVAEVRFVLTRVPFPRPGLYVFRLLAGGAELEGGITDLRVFPGEPK